jgi:4-hydroxy-4-methyl-2-oxoglutarate aldolase
MKEMSMEAELKQLQQAGTAVIADLFDSLGRTPPVLDTTLFPVTGPGVRFVGPAYTIAGESHQEPIRGDRAKLAAIDEMPRGVVAIWAGNDIRGVCCFGDLLATAMKARGCQGVVVDGGVRDTAFLRTLGLPMLARYRTPAQAIGRWRVVNRQIPVQVRGALTDWVTVEPSDIVVADDDGVIIVPGKILAEVAARAVAWGEAESGAREEISRGLPLVAALEKYGHL